MTMPRELPLTAAAAASGLRGGAYSSVELTAAALARADAIDDELGSFAARFDDDALERAQHADELLSRGVDRGPFHGIPIGLKDILAFDQGPTRGNSLVLDPAWGEGRQGPAVSRLVEAGAVIVGKQTTFEFATGYPDPVKTSAMPRNPWDLRRTSGGSSAGTGSGVAAGLTLGGIGTDTGGSIRVPAAYCGVTGLKTTYGLVPTSGCVPLAHSLDSIGPIARSARDCAALLSIIAGPHDSDTARTHRRPRDYLSSLTGHLRGMVVGVVRPDGLDPEPAERFDDAIDVLRALGARTTGVALPWHDEVDWAWSVTIGSEGFAYHRNDLRARWQDYHAMTRLNLAQGTLYSGADYVQAGRVRRAAQRALAELFARVDVVVTPTVGGSAPLIADSYAPRVSPNTGRTFTTYWSAVGFPALAVPMGFSDDDMPLSMQIAGLAFTDDVVLRAGDAYQSVTDWHRRRPTLRGLGDDLGPLPSGVIECAEPDGEVSRLLLERAGISPTSGERGVLEAAYQHHARGIESLYAMPMEPYADPAAEFRAGMATDP